MMKTHRVKPGDTLDSIAHAYYGDWHAWTYIWKHNRHEIENPNVLAIGQVIVIPHVPGREFQC